MMNLNVKNYYLFIYEIDGKDEYFVMGRNDEEVFVSFKHIGSDCDFDTVTKMLSSTVKSYSFSASYKDITESIRNFIMYNSFVCDIPRNTIQLYTLYNQIKDAGKVLERIKSPEEKIRLKALKEREARNERIRAAREEYNGCGVCYVSMKNIVDAYLESIM